MSTFDPTKPVRWKNGRPFGRLLYADGGDSFFYEATDGVRSILSREFFERNAENIPEPPPKPGPTDNECTELIYRITNERWDESAVKGWFADVTARIEREKKR